MAGATNLTFEQEDELRRRETEMHGSHVAWVGFILMVILIAALVPRVVAGI